MTMWTRTKNRSTKRSAAGSSACAGVSAGSAVKSTLLAVIVAAGVTLIAQDPVVRPDAPLIDVPPRTTLSDTDRDRLIKRLIDRLTRQYSGLPATTPEPKP